MPEPSHCLRQASALAVRDGRVCLITSSSGRRWILPKGMIEPGHTAAETAVREAWEEAGVAGELLREPLGVYLATKWGQPCVVSVYGLVVGEVTGRWPESNRRQRMWVSPARAAEVLDVPAVQQIVAAAFADGGAFHHIVASGAA